MDEDLTRGAAARLEAAGDLAAVQEIVRTTARALGHADGATFVLRDGDQCFYADEDAISPLWKGQRFPLTNCISGWAMRHGETVVIPDITVDPRVPLEAYRPTFVQSLAMVPVGTPAPAAAIGVYWARLHTATDDEVGALGALAAATAAAIGRLGPGGAARPPGPAGEALPGTGDPAVQFPVDPAALEDHERIARDLHDTVLQRMFGAGLQLQVLQASLKDPSAAVRLGDVVGQIDEAIRELRGVIFGLEYGHHRFAGLRGRVLAVAAESSRTLGFAPEVSFEGPVEEVDEALHHEALGALREMLSNTGRHAEASAVAVACRAGTSLCLSVTDDGVGVAAEHPAGNGLRNLAARAGALGGTFTLVPAGGGGTVATWSVPRAGVLRAAAPAVPAAS